MNTDVVFGLVAGTLFGAAVAGLLLVFIVLPRLC